MNTRPSSRTIKRLYLDEGLSRTAIAGRLGVPHSFVTKSLSQSSVDMRPQKTPTIVTELVTSEPHRPRTVMDKGRPIMKCQIRLTLELTYTLGWILGDGYANKREIDAIVSLREQLLNEPLVRRELERFGKVFVVPRRSCQVSSLVRRRSMNLWYSGPSSYPMGGLPMSPFTLT
jgi:hypothetical protein